MSKLFAHAKRMLTGVLVVATILTTAPTYAFATENTDDRLLKPKPLRRL